jgi:hypothetical protein
MNSTDDYSEGIIPTQFSLPMCETLENTTFQPSIASSEDSHASLIPTPVIEKARMIAGTCGLNSPELSASFDPDASCWKTSPVYATQLDLWTGQAALLTPSQSLETCSKWVTWDEQALYLHPTPDFPTNANDGFAWPTPAASDTTNRQPPKTFVITAGGIPRHINSSGQQSQVRLSQAVMMYERNSDYLNPDWVDQLMGFPLGWSALHPSLAPDNHSTNGKPLERLRKVQLIAQSAYSHLVTGLYRRSLIRSFVK